MHLQNLKLKLKLLHRFLFDPNFGWCVQRRRPKISLFVNKKMAEKSLVKILDKAWAIKQDLSPQDETGQRKLMLEFIRSEFSEELEKKDCQSIVT